ncbi:hypothetical protein ACI5KX_00625 [Erythrobacter sp. GH1-10]|uniref:hypothetical protein n=1 Tax=Erythrobacter sp. GH1-10 TaxID=3349334 RepID=UPI00387813F8
MTKRRAIRLIAPITVGPALVGIALLHRSSADVDRMRWDEDDRSSLVKAARRPPEDSPELRFTLPAADRAGQSVSMRTKVQAQSSTSDRALVGKMVPPPLVPDPVIELPEPAFGFDAPDQTMHVDQHDRSGAPADLAIFSRNGPLFLPGADIGPMVGDEPLDRSGLEVRSADFVDATDEPRGNAPGIGEIAVLAEDSGPIVIALEIESLALAGIDRAVPGPADAIEEVSDSAPAFIVALPEAELPAASMADQEDTRIEVAGPADDPLAEERPVIAFEAAEYPAELADRPVSRSAAPEPSEAPADPVPKAGPGPSATRLAEVAPPPVAEPSSSLRLPTNTEAQELYGSILPFEPRPKPAARVADAGNLSVGDAPGQSTAPAKAQERSASTTRPKVAVALDSLDYTERSGAGKSPLSLKALLPNEVTTVRNRILPSPGDTGGPVLADALSDAGSSLASAAEGADGSASGPTSISARSSTPTFTYEDELILQIQVSGVPVNDTIIAYGNRDGVYLPLGELGRILDLAIRVSDDGNYASGWFLSEDRTLTIDLRSGTLITVSGSRPMPRGYAVAFDGELFLRADAFAELLPLEVKADLRAQRVLLTTLEPFPFEERMRRDNARALLNARNAVPEQRRWPREETPYLPISVPMADIELRGVSDTARGDRGEMDLRLAADLAWMTAQSYLGVTTRDGLVAALIELGRRDPDAELLGPMRATEFQLGDVSTTSMALGLRGATGRGAYITNQPFDSVSLFDRIDLRGVLIDGYEVELYRNNILLGSTRDAVNGQYEFLQVPVDYGLNVFRLVFYGPQGQRREELRRITVGDGRLAEGELTYTLGAIQRNVNLLGVTGPDFRPSDRYGDWQGVVEVSYGLTPGLTMVANGALFEDDGEDRWIAGMGLRSGIGGFALRADAGISDGGGHAMGLGIGGRVLGGAFTLSHFEYGGGFIDETRAFSSQPLRRATELDFNTSLNIGGLVSGTYLPITVRSRHLEFASGQKQTNATLRSSLRIPGMLASSTFEFSRNESPFGSTVTQLFGNFDLASFNQSDTQFRGSLGYRISPDPEITTVSGEVNYAFDDRTVVRGSTAYNFLGDDFTFGLSAIREFERFTLALDGRYRVREDDYAVVLRLGFSLGHDPKRKQVFMYRPGLASSGAVSARVFHDTDGDGLFGAGDRKLPGVGLAVYNNASTTDADGLAMLGELGDGNRVSVRIDRSTLPDILMAPVSGGIEIVPRPGRIHTTEIPIVELSEIEGFVAFVDGKGGRGVSGLRLQLVDEAREAKHFVRTERGGYYFFEEVKPGIYDVIIEPEQAARLNICLSGAERIEVAPTGDVISRDLKVGPCTTPESPARD